VSLAKHRGTPDACPACLTLPIDFGERQEVIWAHALAQFVDQSGVDVAGLSRSDLVPLVRTWARAGTVTLMDRELLAADFDAPETRRHSVDRLFAILVFAILVCLSIISVGVWSFLS
jgi:hypothetical protein